MSEVIIIAFFCLVIPTLLMLGFLEPKSRMVIGYMIIGIAVALIASQANTFLLMLFDSDYSYVTVNVTPLCEEVLKAIPVCFYAAFVSKKRENIVSVAFACGVGFALLENLTQLLSAGTGVTLVWVIARGLGAGLMHGICTAAVGWGLSLVIYRKKLLIPGTFSLLVLAVLFHSIYNTMVESPTLRYIGINLPIAAYIVMFIKYFSKYRKNSTDKG